MNEFVDDAVFEMTMDEKHTVKVAFNTKQFPDVTRWLMANPDLQVAAFALPATSRTEGRTAAKKKGTLISFKVTTGLED